ncbi:mediator complex subunit 27-domain-containing protein [Mortierella sp. GBAus27b]|nr:mediator complex subunit 27-domain-containing protein [Mortierella sp. GBAus27b]
MSGPEFHDHARFTYTALGCLGALAITTEGILADTQAVELAQLQGPSPVSLEAKHKEALEEEKANAGSKRKTTGETTGSVVDQRIKDYLNLSIDDTIRWFNRAMKRSDQKIRATRTDDHSSMPFSTIKLGVSGVLNAFIVMETSKKGRCLSISRFVVFGAGEENATWEESNHLVFRKITQIAIGAVDYFMGREPKSLLGLVLEWLATYSTLFTTPCTGCGKHLFFDSQQFKHLPPTLYTYKQPTTQPFHPQCLA